MHVRHFFFLRTYMLHILLFVGIHPFIRIVYRSEILTRTTLHFLAIARCLLFYRRVFTGIILVEGWMEQEQELSERVIEMRGLSPMCWNVWIRATFWWLIIYSGGSSQPGCRLKWSRVPQDNEVCNAYLLCSLLRQWFWTAVPIWLFTCSGMPWENEVKRVAVNI